MKKTKQIAPRLVDDFRDPVWMSMPSEYKEGLRAIAKMENKSVSWVVQEIMVDFCHTKLRIPLPRYLVRGKTTKPKARVLRYVRSA